MTWGSSATRADAQSKGCRLQTWQACVRKEARFAPWIEFVHRCLRHLGDGVIPFSDPESLRVVDKCKFGLVQWMPIAASNVTGGLMLHEGFVVVGI